MAIMSKKRSPWLVLLGLCIASTVAGCGTILSTKLGPATSVDCTRELPPPLPSIYIGTISYFRGPGDLDRLPRDAAFLLPLIFIDVPLSLIADTLILPLTIYEQNKYGDYQVVCPHTY